MKGRLDSPAASHRSSGNLFRIEPAFGGHPSTRAEEFAIYAVQTQAWPSKLKLIRAKALFVHNHARL